MRHTAEKVNFSWFWEVCKMTVGEGVREGEKKKEAGRHFTGSDHLQ